MSIISVIIPTYNRADIVTKTIDSFLAQSSKEFELIIVDDGSTDNTKEVVEAYRSPLIRYFYKTNAERAAARNYGAEKANGEFLNFFDSDDIALPNHIELAHQVISEHPSIEAFQFHMAFEGDTGVKTMNCPNVTYINKHILYGKYVCQNGVFFRKSVFEKYRFNESRSLSGTEDWDMLLRMIPDVEIRFFPIVTNHVIQHGGRSVLQFNEDALVKRYEELIKSISTSGSFMNKYSKYLRLVQSRMLSYIALHAILDKHKKIAIRYLKRSVRLRFSELFTRRTLAIIKRLIF